MNEIIKFYLRENENFIELHKLLKASNLTYSGQKLNKLFQKVLLKLMELLKQEKEKKF